MKFSSAVFVTSVTGDVLLFCMQVREIPENFTVADAGGYRLRFSLLCEG
jgi:hypothetical protein